MHIGEARSTTGNPGSWGEPHSTCVSFDISVTPQYEQPGTEEISTCAELKARGPPAFHKTPSVRVRPAIPLCEGVSNRNYTVDDWMIDL
jgi:hypothetical protein